MKYYDTIEDLPMYNWRKINKTNDINFLCYEGKAKTWKQIKTLNEVLQNIKNQFIDTFGISEAYRTELEIKRDILVIEASIATTGDRSQENFKRIKQKELERLYSELEETDNAIGDKAIVEKFMGFKINDKECTVAEYYGYIELLKKHNTSNKD